MKRALEFLQDCGTFYLATTEGDQPRVRPFGAIFEFEGKLYTATNNTKACFKQMMANPKVEISGMNAKGEWIRIAGDIACDDRREAKAFALEAVPVLKTMYQADDGIFTVMYFKEATATIASFTGNPETFSF
ncbi:pyridoxamine 5'-phosphate oxidase family protein [Fusibacter ferrireducens]|uniref:Pyridoxamine 5'-phosphate oxidase family protein n=1 Tax=Fusibacter ferrireducens TaxID=2785058 RepID=A0ABR9ZW06_9FIRM|nr:pyridoxamine 5'-phosphate oxidase family protein [Fusibacter ferrireducens]MBF4694648.1 pyridoxamine 5'-phosphate oxidase family protein [Fusibacter ferrireducens]